MQRLEPVQLFGVTKEQIQQIYEDALREFKTRIFFLDASYLYTFHLDDFEYVKKFNKLARYEPKANIEWHGYLERWYQDQTVTIGGHTFKPIKISRSLDRVVNQGMELLAGCIVGEGSAIFNHRGIGDGTTPEVSLADVDMFNLVDIIDVTDAPEGGSLTRDGTTVYSVGNHAKSVPTPANGEFTESAMFDSDTVNKKMLDHSIFDDPIPHTQNADAPGSTTIIYMCSG
jgi:hypothetical protein